MKEKPDKSSEKGVYVTIKLAPRLNAFIEEKTKTSLLSKRKQIIYLLMQSMRIDGYMER
ncbi:hypothetical protein [Escherichia coli]|uniref:hypothetical protein n=1 Tax=Escherichia coli TaxID=562 RepID=UPI00039C009D|nr:hypothetical protein [Escherichia coli]